jgi:hypothetical protein
MRVVIFGVYPAANANGNANGNANNTKWCICISSSAPDVGVFG